MKTKNIFMTLLSVGMMTINVSCNDYLDREPESAISPENYFKTEDQVKAYVDYIYSSVIISHSNAGTGYGIFGIDKGTDNQIDGAESKYVTGEWKVPNTDTNWNFKNIYYINYFFSQVMPKYNSKDNSITGTAVNIQHYIGEMYFMRAMQYFTLYQKFGDFPIITEPLVDDEAMLTAASKRSPRNEVARFIIANLDSAITFLGAKDMATTRVNKDVATLLKSRVALFEGTWLKYFKGTAFVPQGEGWPGKDKDYNANYQFPSGSIDSEIKYFLQIAATASKEVAEKYKGNLTQNTGYFQTSLTQASNPYYDMWGSVDLSSYKEVLLWHAYLYNQVEHDAVVGANEANFHIGLTRSYVQNFLMADGTPVYRHGSYALGDGYYKGDTTITAVRANRDSRLSIFLKDPGQHNILDADGVATSAYIIEPYPKIYNTSTEESYSTGYTLHKGDNWKQSMHDKGKNYTGCVCFRATEALLNYMEASYELSGTVDATASEYWKLIRRRACMNEDFNKTISQTDMNKEAENDWAAYSAGKLIDPILYNIRRERRCEFLAEGFRYMDLCRWRAMDQLMTKSYIPEGFHLWNTPMEKWYTSKQLIADGSDKSTASKKELSEYMRPLQKNSKQLGYNGLNWHLAHYLYPIMLKQFLLTASDGKTISESPIYQNPYWPTTADSPAEK
jgi:hypothetical protein